MPNQLPVNLPFTAPFTSAHFYLVPLPWVQGVTEAGDLDARDLLLAQVVEGQVIFADMHDEQQWHQHEEQVRPFFTRRTYERYRKALLARGLLRPYRPGQPPVGVTKTVWRDLQRGIKYLAHDWPGAEWLYRPRGYLLHRWPVWLGNADVASRLVLLALCAEVGRLVQTPATPLPTQVTLSWRQLHTFVTALGQRPDDLPAINAQLRKGVQELLLLGAITELTDGPSQYRLELSRLAQPPLWSLPAIAQRCQADPVQDAVLLPLVRDLMRTCWEPVTRLPRVWRAVQAVRQSADLLDEADLLDLQKFLHIQRPGPPLRHDHLLQAFLRRRQATDVRLMSGCFLLTAQEIMVTATTVEGAPLLMPAESAHGLAATQLWIRCLRRADLTVAAAQEILAQTQLIISQEQADGLPRLIPLVCHPPQALSIDFGYVLRANQLHSQLEYSRPFEVILRCRRPDPRLQLDCRFRLLRQRGR